MTDDMRKLIDEVEWLDREATPGPWRLFSGGGYASIGRERPSDVVEKRLGSMHPYWDHRAGRELGYGDEVKAWHLNFDLIATFRTAAPVLAAEVERLDARLAEVERERDEAWAAEDQAIRAANAASAAMLAAERERDEALPTLAAEQGRQEGAPSEGWQWTGEVWFHAPTCMVVEPAGRLWRLSPDAGDPRHWRLSRLEPMPARAAMLAADAATG